MDWRAGDGLKSGMTDSGRADGLKDGVPDWEVVCWIEER